MSIRKSYGGAASPLAPYLATLPMEAPQNPLFWPEETLKDMPIHFRSMVESNTHVLLEDCEEVVGELDSLVAALPAEHAYRQLFSADVLDDNRGSGTKSIDCPSFIQFAQNLKSRFFGVELSTGDRASVLSPLADLVNHWTLTQSDVPMWQLTEDEPLWLEFLRNDTLSVDE
eukprot:g5243.t1